MCLSLLLGNDPETAAEAAMEMSLLPKDGGWSVPAQLAETAVTHGTNHARLPYFQLVKGLVEYRRGGLKVQLNGRIRA